MVKCKKVHYFVVYLEDVKGVMGLTMAQEYKIHINHCWENCELKCIVTRFYICACIQ